MKKYFVLTSVLALTACFGGSGGGGTGSGTPRSIYARSAMQEGSITSNKDITQMDAEILVPRSGGSAADVIEQRSSTLTHNGKSYTSYRLDDVKFFTAENLNEDDPKTRSFLRLELDRSGAIEAIHMDVGGVSSGRTVRSKENSKLFEGPIFEYVKNGQDEAVQRIVDTGQTWQDLEDYADKHKLNGGHWNRIDERFDIKTYGDDVDNDSEKTTTLSYSDFGYFNPVYKTKFRNIDADTLGYIRQYEEAVKNGDTKTAQDIKTNYLSRKDGDEELDSFRTPEEFEAELLKEDYQLFAGGYAIRTDGKKVDTLTPQKGTSFTGKAVGRVYSSIKTADGIDRKGYLDKYGIEYHSTNQLDSNYHDPDDAGFIKPEDAGHDISKAYSTANATLVVDGENGTQTLVMPFSDTGFYDVTVVKPVDAAATITFDSSTKPDKDEDYGYGYMYRRDADITGGPAGSVNNTVSEFNPGYYGIDNPSEAAGTVRYKEVKNFESNAGKREWEFQGAYGMKLDTTTNP